MGGTVWVESREGQGSIFHFTMILAWPSEVGGEAQEQQVEPAGQPLLPTAASPASPTMQVPCREAAGSPGHSPSGAAPGGGMFGPAGGEAEGDPQWAAVELHRARNLARSWASSLSLTSTTAAPGTPGNAAAESAGGPLPYGSGGGLRGPGHFAYTGGSSSAASLAPASQAGTSMRGAGSVGANPRTSQDTQRSSLDALASRDSLDSTTPSPPARLAAEAAEPGRSSFAFPSPPSLPAGGGCSGSCGGAGSGGSCSSLAPVARVDYRLSSLYAPTLPTAQPAAAAGTPFAAAAAAAAPVAARRQLHPGGVSSPASNPNTYNTSTTTSPRSPAASASPRAQPFAAQPASAAAAEAAANAPAPYQSMDSCGSGSSSMPSCCREPWPSAGAAGELAQLAGMRVVVAVAHHPTALQIVQSCQLVGMEARLGAPQGGGAVAAVAGPPGMGEEGAGTSAGAAVNGAEAAAEPQSDFLVTTCGAALAAIRGGWRGRPVVAVGSGDDMPISELGCCCCCLGAGGREGLWCTGWAQVGRLAGCNQRRAPRLRPPRLVPVWERVLARCVCLSCAACLGWHCDLLSSSPTALAPPQLSTRWCPSSPSR